MLPDLPRELKDQLYRFSTRSGKKDNGQVLIIGGSCLFHGAPLLALKTASRVAGMVFFTSPEPSTGETAAQLKSSLSSFIWIPWEAVEEYIEKAEAILIGPGMLREHANKGDKAVVKCQNIDKSGWETKNITERLLKRYSGKQWVIDAGSLQVMEAKFIPKRAILTPNRNELRRLFGPVPEENLSELLKQKSQEHQCVIVYKDNGTMIVAPDKSIELKMDEVGINKGGMGDVLAGLTVGLAAKNLPFVAAGVAAYVNQKAAENLHQKFGFAYNADDLAEEVPKVLGEFWR